MPIVTVDIREAKRYVHVTAQNMRYQKQRAHRATRRNWRRYLAEVAQGSDCDDAREIDLCKPGLTGWDIS
jgi:hypothetical protein